MAYYIDTVNMKYPIHAEDIKNIDSGWEVGLTLPEGIEELDISNTSEEVMSYGYVPQIDGVFKDGDTWRCKFKYVLLEVIEPKRPDGFAGFVEDGDVVV